MIVNNCSDLITWLSFYVAGLIILGCLWLCSFCGSIYDFYMCWLKVLEFDFSYRVPIGTLPKDDDRRETLN